MDELKKLLEGVSDTYEDFVLGVMNAVKHSPDDLQNVIGYIKEDNSRTSSDITDYLDVLGI